jgi:hypothetical protein
MTTCKSRKASNIVFHLEECYWSFLATMVASIRIILYCSIPLLWNATDAPSYMQHCLKTFNFLEKIFKKSSTTCFGLYRHHQVLTFLLYANFCAHLVLFLWCGPMYKHVLVYLYDVPVSHSIRMVVSLVETGWWGGYSIMCDDISKKVSPDRIRSLLSCGSRLDPLLAYTMHFETFLGIMWNLQTAIPSLCYQMIGCISVPLSSFHILAGHPLRVL